MPDSIFHDSLGWGWLFFEVVVIAVLLNLEKMDSVLSL